MDVFITGRIPDQVIERIKRQHSVTSNLTDKPLSRDELLDQIGGYQGLLCTITDRVDSELLDRADTLKMIANYGVGYDNIDVVQATRRSIPVSNTPGVLTDATADLAMALILGTGRRLVAGDIKVRRGDFKFWAPMHFLGTEISGKTLGLIGFGRIGRAVAKRAAGFNMPIIYHTRQPLASADEKEFNVAYRPLKRLLQEADYLSLHVPLTDETRHLIDAAALRKMKPSAILINTSRGAVVDEKALVAALKKGIIQAAGLDVYEKEPELTPGLIDLENVTLLPHVGSATIETRTRMADMAVDNLLAGLAGRKPPNCLNWEGLPGNE